jgi:hypothetical protein
MFSSSGDSSTALTKYSLHRFLYNTHELPYLSQHRMRTPTVPPLLHVDCWGPHANPILPVHWHNGCCLAKGLYATILWRVDPLLGKDLKTDEYIHCYATGSASWKSACEERTRLVWNGCQPGAQLAELSVDESSAQEAETRGSECGKLKNLPWYKLLPRNSLWRL